MAADLLVWDSAIGLDPLSDGFFDRVEAMIMAEPSEPPTQIIEDFAAAILLRFPDSPEKQGDASTVWTFEPLLAGAHGWMMNLHMTWEGYRVALPFILETAGRLRLNVYDHQDNAIHGFDGSVLAGRS